jgi:hypothetical protein
MREPFDYTKWQRELWAEKTADEISGSAMKFRKEATDDCARNCVEKNI